jgi:hypothetical protein
LRITGPEFQLEYITESTLTLRREVVLTEKLFSSLRSDAGAAGDGIAFAARSRRGSRRSEQWEIIARMNRYGSKAPIGDNT